ncbi:MAG: hypothetical protein WCW66_05410 [Patescibacteria group bacterium]
MECLFCGHKGESHDQYCPNGHKVREQIFWRGYDEGRTGNVEHPTSQDPIFVMGFYKGVCNLEEAVNGYDPRFD